MLFGALFSFLRKLMKRFTLLLLLLVTTGIYAQGENVFLSRSFWKSNPSVALIKDKINEGHDATALNRYAFDGVVYAILEKANLESIQYLLSLEGNGVNKITHDKRTYVFWAAYANNVPLMNYLIANGARMDLKDSHQYSVATFAAATGKTNTEIYDLCIQHGIDLKNDLDGHGAHALLLLLPHVKDLSILPYFTAKGMHLEDVDADGNGAFNYVAKTGNTTLLQVLIEKGLPYKKLNNKGENAFILATRGSRKGYNSLEFFKYLTGLGLNPAIVSKDGQTALHNLAYGNKDSETLNYFIEKGTPVDQQNAEGNTALSNAARRNNLAIVTLLADKTSNINTANKKGQTALTNAIYGNTPEVVAFLLQRGANAKHLDKKGNNIAYYLVKGYSDRAVDNFDKKLALLQKQGMALNQLQANNKTLIHIAVEKNNLNLLKKLTGLKLDINAKDSDGMTALHRAVMQAKNTKLIKYLLQLGADKKIVTNFGESVYDLAKENEVLRAQQTDLNFLK